MNANMPVIQMLGSAAGAINTASPASSAPGAPSPFSAIMGGILGQPAEGAAVTTTAISSDSGVSSESILSSGEFQQISSELLAALNGLSTKDGLAVLAGKLATLLSELGNGKMVPLSAGFDLSQLAEAGVELPEGLESAMENGQALLLVDEGALKALLAGGGWKDGLNVPALLMAESGNTEHPRVTLVQAGLSAVASASVQPGEKPLQFQLTFDPNTTININSDNQPASALAGTQVTNLAEVIAWLRSVAADGKSGSGDETDEAEGSDPADVLAAILGDKTSPENAATENTTDTTELKNPEEAEAAPPAAQTGVSDDAGGRTRKLAAKVNDLISALLGASGRERATDSTPVSAVDRIAAALELLAGQAASSGDNEAAGRTLEMIEKLGRLSQLGEGEKQQVLTDLAASLSSLLAGAAKEDTGTENTNTTQAFDASGASAEKAADVLAATGVETETDETVAVESEVAGLDIDGESGAGTVIRAIENTENSQTNNAGSAQGTQVPADNPRTLLAALETVAAAAGELAEKLTGSRSETHSGHRRSSDSLVQKIAGTLQQQTTATVQPVLPNEKAGQTAQPVPTNGNQVSQPQTPGTSSVATASGAESRVMEQSGAPEAAQVSVDKTQSTQPAGQKTGQDDNSAMADTLTSAAAVDSDGQKVTVPVSLSSLNKIRKTQSKTETTAAVNAYSANSSAQRPEGEGNDLQKALRTAGGEKAMSDLVEATVVEKKAESIETLGRVESAESDQKSGGVQAQGGMRAEQTAGRVQNFRGELQQQAGSVDTAGQAEAFEKIINSARLIKTGATTELNMKLEPDHLGMMRVRMSVDDNKVMHATIQVESQEARTMIESNLHRLRESLAEQGIKVEKFSVDVRQDQQNQSQHQSAGAGREGQWERSGQGAAHNADGSAADADSAGQGEDLGSGMSVKTKIYGYSTLEWVA